MKTPEAKARVLIDAQLEAAGWVLQDRDQLDRRAALGVAVREYPLVTVMAPGDRYVPVTKTSSIETLTRSVRPAG